MINLEKNNEFSEYTKSFLCDFGGEKRKFNVEYTRYPYNNAIAIILVDDNDKAYQIVASTNVDGIDKDEVGIKDYDANEGVYKLLMDNGIIYPAHRWIPSGYVYIPICKLVSPSDFPIYLSEDKLSEKDEGNVSQGVELGRTYFRMKDVLSLLDGSMEEDGKACEGFMSLPYAVKIEALKRMAEEINDIIDDKWYDIACDVVSDWKKVNNIE